MPSEISGRLPEFRDFFFSQLAGVFLIPNNEDVTEHIALCSEVISELKSIYLESYSGMCEQTQ